MGALLDDAHLLKVSCNSDYAFFGVFFEGISLTLKFASIFQRHQLGTY